MRSAILWSTSATVALSTVFAPAIDMEEATIRNSNLFPVKANGDVRLRSVASFLIGGMVWTPISIRSPLLLWVAVPFCKICSTISSNCSPRKIEMIAGGASFAPRRWSFPGLEADIRNSAALSSTAAITADKNRRNCLLSYGVLPGLNKFFPVLVTKDQLSCFPEPFTPANGFSWRRHSKLWRRATFFIVSITNWLWSVAIFAVL